MTSPAELETSEQYMAIWHFRDGKVGVAATVSRATGTRPQDVESQAARQMVTGRFSRPEEVADLADPADSPAGRHHQGLQAGGSAGRRHRDRIRV